jgi:glycosyltransferase involved in cell wall biosynthesis
MKRLLMISHAPGNPIRTRTGEIARALASQGHDVEVYTRNFQPKGLSIPQKLAWHAGELFRPTRIETLAPNFRTICPPTFNRGAWLSDRMHRLAARQMARRNYDAIVSASYDGPAPRPRGSTRFVYDLVDDHGAGFRHAGQPDAAEQVERYMADRARSADLMIVSSLVLQDFARDRFGREAHLVPNGADVMGIRSKIADLGESASVVGEAAGRVGYVGGLDGFVRIDLVVRALKRLRDLGRAIEMVVVGDGEAIRGWEIPDWVHLKGFRPPLEIPGLIGSFQVGTVPFEISPFTDAALPLKVLEYGAARRITVSSPLEELKRQAFPWVVLAENDEQSWTEALDRALEMRWDPSWDAIVDRFDWSASARTLIGALE